MIVATLEIFVLPTTEVQKLKKYLWKLSRFHLTFEAQLLINCSKTGFTVVFGDCIQLVHQLKSLSLKPQKTTE